MKRRRKLHKKKERVAKREPLRENKTAKKEMYEHERFFFSHKTYIRLL